MTPLEIEKYIKENPKLKLREIVKNLGEDKRKVENIKYYIKKRKRNMPAKIEISEDQLKIITDNYGKVNMKELSKMTNIKLHTLYRKLDFLKIKPKNNVVNIDYNYSLTTDGRHFDIEKYKLVAL